MILYPAIDLKNGQCVRLYKGDMAQDTVYNTDPAAQARAWQDAGFKWIHVVDLDGAIKGASANAGAIMDILSAVTVPVQLGGGIRSMDQIEGWLGSGAARIILGTAAVRDPDLVRRACAVHPGKIAVGIDARDGRVAVQGWVERSDMQVTELAKHFEGAGVSAIIHTDIERDGTGSGVNVAASKALSLAVPGIPVIASGGAGGIEDVVAVKQAGLAGLILGKALYEGRIDAQQAIKMI